MSVAYFTFPEIALEQIDAAAAAQGGARDGMIVRVFASSAANAFTEGATREARIKTFLTLLVDMQVDRAGETIKQGDQLRRHPSVEL